MISQKKAADMERAYRNLLYRRPVGIFSVLLFLGVSIFATAMVLSAMKISFPFFTWYIGTFSLLIVAIAVHWLLQSFALLRKKNWSGLIMVPLGLGAGYFGIRLLGSAIVRFHQQ